MTGYPPALRGALFMVLAALCWTAMMILVRSLGGAYSAFEILFLRNLVTVAFILPLLLRSPGAVFRTRRMGLHCTRVAFAYIGVLGLFYGLIHIPVADVVALSFTQPLFIAVLAAILLGEAVGIARWRAVAIGFAGVLVIVRPGFAMIGVGLGGMGGIYFVSRAYAAADASAVVPYDFLRLPLSACAAWILFGETSDIWMLTGAAIIFASSYALVRIETREAKDG